MWQKYFKIAERQFEAGKDKSVEGHTLKALQYAQEAKNPQQIATTLQLLQKFYLQTNNPLALDILRQSLDIAEAAFGANSDEEGLALQEYSRFQERDQDFDGAEKSLQKALSIYETRASEEFQNSPQFAKSGAIKIAKPLPKAKLSAPVAAYDEDEETDPTEDLMNALSMLTFLYTDAGKFAQAETYFLRELALAKQYYGPEHELIEDLADQYVEILEGLGRKDEIEAMDLITACGDCHDAELDEEGAANSDSEVPHVHTQSRYAQKVDAVINTLKANQSKEDINIEIQAYRDALTQLKELSDAESQNVKAGEPFAELKLLTIKSPHRFIQTCLAQLLRLDWQNNENANSLVEAETIARQLLSETADPEDQKLLLLILLDKAGQDASQYQEFDSLLASMPESTTTLYSKALALFKRFGSTADSRQAMKIAFQANPYVTQLLASGGNPQESNEKEENIEAQSYCLVALQQWLSTPGASDFVTEVVITFLSPSMRRKIDQLALQQQALQPAP